VSRDDLRASVERLTALTDPPLDEARAVVASLLDALESGAVRAAISANGTWETQAWVKAGILLAFRVGRNRAEHVGRAFHFRDRDTLATWDVEGAARDVRIVPGGTTVRRGAHLAEGVVVMPPAYVNVGAFVGRGSMIDSHALVGSCAQVGERVHVSAAVQIGGVLEPVGALPVVIEDDAFLGGGCGVYEGTRVGRGAVLAPGVVLSRGVPLFDLPRDTIHRAASDRPLEVPPGAVVVPGTRPAAGESARRNGVQIAAAIVVKYRDASTAAATLLEQALR
jgi:2,3,4,5-tetrahydropyridine-2,6-dicarboxylate N-succinyltransferase